MPVRPTAGHSIYSHMCRHLQTIDYFSNKIKIIQFQFLCSFSIKFKIFDTFTDGSIYVSYKLLALRVHFYSYAIQIWEFKWVLHIMREMKRAGNRHYQQMKSKKRLKIAHQPKLHFETGKKQ